MRRELGQVQFANHVNSPAIQLVTADANPAAGAEHSFVWPCPAENLMPTIESLAASGDVATSGDSGAYHWKDVTLDAKRIAVYQRGQRIDLTKTEFDMFKALLDAEGKVLTRQEIMDTVWGDMYFGGSNTVDVHIKSLRQKLGDDPKRPKYVATVRGIGYQLAE
jgi:two-component system alkaline phosphatase synthesis response regulator PhoP